MGANVWNHQIIVCPTNDDFIGVLATYLLNKEDP